MAADLDFRPDASRGVFLSGTIDPVSTARLFPEVLRISGRGPVTLYLDSPGGRPAYATLLHQMLVAPDQDTSQKRRLITVATGFVASAAADLLIAGDYTLAYEHAVIMMHGVRQTSQDDITRESAVDLARSLANSNEQFALTLASNSVATFFFRLVAAFPTFSEVRVSAPTLDDVACFIETRRGKVSSGIQSLLERAAAQCKEMAQLYEEVVIATKPIFAAATRPRTAEVEAAVFKAVLDHELEAHPEADWTFGVGGFEVLQQKIPLIFDQVADRHQQQVATLVKRWGWQLLTIPEMEQILSAPADSVDDRLRDIAEPRIREFWFLLVALCRGLQTDDYFLSAEEAYWLGFIDEIIGRPELPSPRIFAEYVDETNTGEQH